MPPDIAGCVRKFIPNNARLAEVVIKVCRNVYPAPSLPMQLVKLLVDRAFEQSRAPDMKIDSQLFEDKLTQYANQLRPRFMSQIMDLRKRGRKW